MLLEFKLKNYKSFKNKASLNLIPAQKQKDLEYCILEKKINNKIYKALPTSVLYGPNASGKTNIIGAIETLVFLVNRGHIRNETNLTTFNVASISLELIPNKDLNKKQPVEFYISFIKNEQLIEYFLRLDLGLFLEESEREVLFEELKVNNIGLFTREKTVLTLNSKYSKAKQLKNILSSNLNKEDLFISNGFKNMIDNLLFNEIQEFLNKDLIVIYRADLINIGSQLETDKIAIKDQELSNVANEIGSLNSNIGFFSPKKDGPKKLTTFINFTEDKKEIAIPAELIESYGTIRFLNLYPIIKKTLKEGGVLIVDEFDASIHPMVLLDIVNIFHNDEINTNQAQLIFNTHNPIFLSPSVLRRDEIKFVDRDKEGSNIYSLADFKTTGKQGVRNTHDYMKHYFINKYGSILNIDLTNFLDPNIAIEVIDE